MKQHLKIKSFWGTTLNAVKIQMYCAVFAYCLVALVGNKLKVNRSIYEIRATLKNTSESWVACIFFIMNLILYEKGCFFGSILEKVNIMGVRIMECVEKILVIVFSAEGYPSGKIEVKY
jgi:hypothetical protein